MLSISFEQYGTCSSYRSINQKGEKVAKVETLCTLRTHNHTKVENSSIGRTFYLSAQH